ncbi:MAG: hypothetical protein Kow0022_17120 [Phycisphaerales bacterium]
MPVLEPLELSLSLADVPLSVPPRGVASWVAEQGFRWVQLDGTVRFFRARELSGSARRDLAGTLTRAEVRLSGIDLWIPPEHFADSAHVDRAMAAVTSAAEMLGELRRLGVTAPTPVVSVMMPAEPSEGVRDALAAAGDAHGVIVVDHAPAAADTLVWGADPAAILMAGGQPPAEVSRRGARVMSARLDDANAMGRCMVESGRLDVLAYAMALSTARVDGPVVVDVRGLSDCLRAIERAKRAWAEATRLPSF